LKNRFSLFALFSYLLNTMRLKHNTLTSLGEEIGHMLADIQTANTVSLLALARQPSIDLTKLIEDMEELAAPHKAKTLPIQESEDVVPSIVSLLELLRKQLQQNQK